MREICIHPPLKNFNRSSYTIHPVRDNSPTILHNVVNIYNQDAQEYPPFASSGDRS